MLRVGKISSIDYGKGTAQITYEDDDDSVTNDYPLLAGKYDMLHVGDVVQVAEDATGGERGLILGRAYSDANPPPEGGAGLWRMESGDGIYRRQLGGELEIMAGGKELTIKAGTLKIEADTLDFVAASGEITINGIPLLQHRHDVTGAETDVPKA